MPKVYGVPLSPFVRKVLITLEEKNIAYDLDPVVPVNVSDEFKKISPLGKVPAYEDDKISISDSSIICRYINDTQPQNSVYPNDPVNMAKAAWFEEYADTKLAETLTFGIFFQRVIRPKFFNEATDEEMVNNTINNDVPVVLDYLESMTDGHSFLVANTFSIADISVGSHFLNAKYGQFDVDSQRWPNVAAYVDKVLSHPAFVKRQTAEQAMM